MSRRYATTLSHLGIHHPLIQAPMAGVSTPLLAAKVSNAGALGSIGIGASTPSTARSMIQQIRQHTDKPFNVNVFVHETPAEDEARASAWLERLRPYFEEFGAEPPKELKTIYKTFAEDEEMLDVLLDTHPPIVSFHFGLPQNRVIRALQDKGIILFASATNLEEAKAIEDAGVDYLVAQGIEAGGHRGVFDVQETDEALPTMVLTRLLVQRCKPPVIAAGGIMDGSGIASALKLGAVAAQLGTAFVGCPESSADEGYRKALFGPEAMRTKLTTLISGRPARSLANRFTAMEKDSNDMGVPSYPIAYDAGKALHKAAMGKGEFGFGAQWAGQGAPMARKMPAEEMVRTLMRELEAAGA